MPTRRLRVTWRALALARRIGTVRRAERAALARLGDAVARAHARLEPQAPALARVLRAGHRLAALDAAASASLDLDRADYAVVAGYMRPVVIARGLAARLVVRHQRRAALADLEAARVDLGRATLDGSAGLPPAAVPRALEEAVSTTRAELAAALDERTALFAPFGGALLPRPLAVAGTEAAAFARALWAQLRAQILPRAPALSGLLVGFWIAETYTDSHWKAALHRIGLGDGGTRVVSPDSYARMRFWLPLLAAAACAYLGSRLGAGIRRRYGAPPAGPDSLPDGSARASLGDRRTV